MTDPGVKQQLSIPKTGRAREMIGRSTSLGRDRGIASGEIHTDSEFHMILGVVLAVVRSQGGLSTKAQGLASRRYSGPERRGLASGAVVAITELRSATRAGDHDTQNLGRT